MCLVKRPASEYTHTPLQSWTCWAEVDCNQQLFEFLLPLWCLQPMWPLTPDTKKGIFLHAAGYFLEMVVMMAKAVMRRRFQQISSSLWKTLTVCWWQNWLWTLAACSHHICSPDCIELLLCDWLIRPLRTFYKSKWPVSVYLVSKPEGFTLCVKTNLKYLLL